MEPVDALSLEFARTHTREAAAALSGLEVAAVAEFLDGIPPRDAAALMALFVPQVAAACLQRMSVLAASLALESLPVDFSAMLLRRVDIGMRFAILDAMPAGIAAAIRSALRFSEAVVGAIMDARMPAVSQDQTVAEALEVLRQSGAGIGNAVFVVDEHKRFTGIVEGRQLLTADASTPLRRLQSRDVEVFSARLELAHLLEHPVWHRLDAVPVVDQKGLLLGGLRRGSLALALAAGRAEELRDNTLTALLFDCADVFWSACADLFAPIPADMKERRR